MKIPCFRCGKEIESPDASNADYVIASDTVVRESRETLIALKHNQATLGKQAKMKETKPILDPDTHKPIGKQPKYPDLRIDDSEYDEIEVSSVKEAYQVVGEDLVRVKAEMREKDIQKTGIICPKCYKKTDFVIWGVHKKKAKLI